MAYKITMYHSSGLICKDAYDGWSWTSFFFGGIPALFRGDFLGFFVYFAIAVLGSVTTAGVANLFLWFLWAAFYNGWHQKRMIENGYSPYLPAR